MKNREEDSWNDLKADLQGCILIGAALMALLLGLSCLLGLFVIQVPREGNKDSFSLIFCNYQTTGQTKTKTFGQVCPRKLAYTKLQLVKTAKLPLDAFQLDH